MCLPLGPSRHYSDYTSPRGNYSYYITINNEDGTISQTEPKEYGTVKAHAISTARAEAQKLWREGINTEWRVVLSYNDGDMKVRTRVAEGGKTPKGKVYRIL